LPARNPSDRALIASIAGNQSWANTADRAARTEAPRKAFLDRFEQQVDPSITDPASRSAAAENLRRAYYKRLALKSAQARRAKKATGGGRAA
jgi:hypothetical protein